MDLSRDFKKRRMISQFMKKVRAVEYLSLLENLTYDTNLSAIYDRYKKSTSIEVLFKRITLWVEL